MTTAERAIAQFAEERATRQAVALDSHHPEMRGEGVAIIDIHESGNETVLCEYADGSWLVKPEWFNYSAFDDDRDLETMAVELAARLQAELEADVAVFVDEVGK